MRSLIVGFVLALGALTAPQSIAEEIRGAGSTFAYPVITKWSQSWAKRDNTSDYQAIGGSVDYQSIGSGGGIVRIKQNVVDFGATDMPLKSEELEKFGLGQFPIVIGGVVPVVNIDGVAPGALKLTGKILADIYLGKINRWSDAAIKAVNPDLKLPDAAIGVIYRADGSGTTFNWVSFLAGSSPEWREKIGVGSSVQWPTGTGFRGNEGVLTAIKNAKNGIAYLEYSYVVQGKLSYALIQNRKGQFVKPEVSTFQAAAAHADWRSARDFYLLLTDAPGDDAYPLTAATFILMPKRPASATRAQAAFSFFKWSLENGAKEAAQLGYVPLPADLVTQVKQYWADAFKEGI